MKYHGTAATIADKVSNPSNKTNKTHRGGKVCVFMKVDTELNLQARRPDE